MDERAEKVNEEISIHCRTLLQFLLFFRIKRETSRICIFFDRKRIDLYRYKDYNRILYIQELQEYAKRWRMLLRKHFVKCSRMIRLVAEIPTGVTLLQKLQVVILYIVRVDILHSEKWKWTLINSFPCALQPCIYWYKVTNLYAFLFGFTSSHCSVM